MVGIALLTRKEGHTPWLLSAQLLEGRLMCGRSSRALGLVHPHGKTGEGTGGSAADSAQACCGRLRARAVEVGDSGVVAVRARTGAHAGRWWCASLDCLRFLVRRFSGEAASGASALYPTFPRAGSRGAAALLVVR